MPYVLGIDVGTSRTAAAVCRLDGSAWPGAQAVRLGEHRDTIESALWLSEDGSVVVGEAAAERAVVEHRRAVRWFTMRIGDDVPVVIGGEQYLPEELTAALVLSVIDGVEAQQGAPPERVVVTHPAGWGGYRRGLLHQALRRIGLANVTLLARPIAAAENHAALASVDAGGLLAVYHLGGEMFEAAVVQRLPTGAFGVLGHLEGAEAVGGAYFDDALAEHLRTAVGQPLDDNGSADPQTRLAAWRARQDCTAVKERLSAATEAAACVRPAGATTEERVTRAQFEEMIEPAVRHTVQVLLRCARSVRVQPEQLDAVVLVGGSSRIPLVGRVVSAKVPCRVAVDADPEMTVAKGAALAARRLLPGAVSIPVQRTDDLDHDSADDFEFAVPPPRPPVEVSPLELPERRAAGQLVSGVRPVVLGVGLTVMFAGVRSPDPAPAGPDPGRARPVQTVSTSVPPTTAAPGQIDRPSEPSQPSRSSQDEGGR